MSTRMFLTALALTAGCGDLPEPDSSGRIVGTHTDGGVTGCSIGQVGRTIWYVRSIIPQGDSGHFQVSLINFAPWTRCCPANSTTAQCPLAALPAAACTGAWPDTMCPTTTTSSEARSCTVPHVDCTAREACTPVRTTAAPTDAGISLAEGAHACLVRCTLPVGADSGHCAGSAGVCLLAPNEPSGSRRGLCYPTSR